MPQVRIDVKTNKMLDRISKRRKKKCTLNSTKQGIMQEAMLLLNEKESKNE